MDMSDTGTIINLISQGLAIFLVVGGAVFVGGRVWPWWIARDSEERQRRYELEKLENATREMMAQALTSIAVLLSPPVKVEITRKSAPEGEKQVF